MQRNFQYLLWIINKDRFDIKEREGLSLMTDASLMILLYILGAKIPKKDE